MSTPEPVPATRALDPYDHAVVEAKWRRRWEETGAHRTDLDAPARPFYNLMMFPYPSAEGLHVGNVYAFTGADIYGRYRRLLGDTVFEPMGFDAFGIHTENFALRIGEHPARMTPRNVAHFRERQLKRLGAMFDWDHEVDTTDPGYYRWTQWIFLRLFDAGLAEQREGPVNWCPSCLTVLADEQVIDGRCERCDSVVEQRVLTQWFLKITRYAKELLEALDHLDWSERTVTAQRNWIGRSEGANIRFDLEGCARADVTVFTTRPDTLYGATFLVIGADHPRLAEFTAPDRAADVQRWRASLPAAGDEPDFSVGVDLGSVAIHPLTGARLPVWAAPYVLGGYGTGAIMAVPAHDQRDWQFAHAHGLPIVEVIGGGDIAAEAHPGDGPMLNSADLDGTPSQEGKVRVVERLRELGRGDATVQYRLRDWLISRQRYWGPPIPIIHCPTHGPVGVPYDQLPVLLPEVEEFRPLGTGASPLAANEDWVNVPCPRCGEPSRRETDVSDTFLDSAWYFLRYPSTDFDDRPFDHDRTVRWLPVDMYIGGNEHAVLHLMYSRFVMRALHEQGLVPDPEPFKRFRAHGLIIRNGAKMSKSKGNVVNPDEYLERHGADTVRIYLMFLGPYTEGGDFRDDGIRGITRFLDRVWRVAQQAEQGGSGGVPPVSEADDVERERRRHRLIAAVGERYAELRYNTAIAFLMEYSDALSREAAEGTARRIDAETLLQLLAPLAPHITEELWERTGHRRSIHDSGWPEHDPAMVAAREVTVVVQVNGRVRDQMQVDAGLDAAELERRARELPRIASLLEGRQVRKVVPVPDRLVNFVVS
ncbi:MAG: leucyl-tRNA synthetase [Chloroflexota bacterium]|jgi:leucyl-tRNA synthetase|nr:leucyl-tRNA synthetase [Chloroflexota bacterium]